MNRAVVVFVAAALAAAAWCEASGPARRRPRGRPSGGLVTKAYTGRRVLVAAGAAAVPAGLVEEALEGVRRTSRLPVFAAEAGGAAPGWEGAVAAAKGLVRGGAAAAVVVADGGCPAALVAAPDEGWAVLDASALLAGADAARARGRMSKGLWRAVAHALGVGGAASCVTGAARAPGGVDALPASPAPDTLNRMVDAAAARGAGLLSFASYRTACEEGWAPAPTNDVQREIWEKVHAVPDKPITIEFDPKKDK